MTKIGSAIRNRVETRTRLSRKPLRRRPVSTPAVRPMTASMTSATRASFSVFGYAVAMMSPISRLPNVWPKSPWSRFFM